MKRILIVALAVLLLVPALLWAGFRIWLVQQPDEFRASIESFDALEFAEVLVDTFFPTPEEDRAIAGRRAYPGRGHSPWVIRSSLDGRPRMLSLALGPELWLAYSTETASIHQLWRGELDFSGPVYDARHGFEPQSRGEAYLRPSTSTPWQIEGQSGWEPATIQWRGHGFDIETGDLWLRFELRSTTGERRTVTEWPSHTVEEASERLRLTRRFEISTGPRIALDAGEGPIEFAASESSVRAGDTLQFGSTLVATQLVHLLSAPVMAVNPALPEELANDPFALHDCHTCHNIRERVVGPAWSEISQRYAGANREVTVAQLASRIIDGSTGRWGSVAMTPHPDLTRSEAAALALAILQTEPGEVPTASLPGDPSERRDEVQTTWSFGSKTEDPPETLHPSLVSTPLDSGNFTPQVGGLAWLPDGRLGVATWDRDGSVFAVGGWQGPVEDVRVTRIAEGLHEPLGLAVVGDSLFVMQKQEITQLIDHNGDDWIDEYRTLTNDWRVTSNFHEFGFGLVPHDGHLYGALSVCVLTGGKSCRDQTPDRGKVFRASIETGEVEFVSSGFRTPNGLALSPDGDLFVADNQGDWLPASKLIHVRPGSYQGWRAPGETRDLGPASAPALWLPQNEIGNSPTQPLFLTDGPYAGFVLFGDIFNGGLKRAFLEKVDGEWQGAAFHFSGGLEGPVNRILAAPEGFIVGQIGQGGNWGQLGKDRFGLERILWKTETAFEPLRMYATPTGFDVHFSRPVADDLRLTPEHFAVADWYYVPAQIYGGPKYDPRELEVEGVTLSPDRRVVSLVVNDLAPGRVVYLHFDLAIRSQRGESLWVNEAWYTLNAIPAPADALSIARHPPTPRAAPPLPKPDTRPNQLSPSEQRNGWRLLFNGTSFDGWKIYGAEDDAIEFWKIDDEALQFTRDVSFAGMIWNHLNPFTRGAVDLMTKERFASFELLVDWKISAGGNSGIFYLVPDETSTLAWDLGLEMQVLDDEGHYDGQIDRHRAGDLYDLQSQRTLDEKSVAGAVGEWNTARIRVQGDHIEHWLNGRKLADIQRGSPEWDRAIAESKFSDTPGFGRATSGHITLQDHGDVVWYRNIKIRPLDSADYSRVED